MDTHMLPWALFRTFVCLSIGAFAVSQFEKIPFGEVFKRLLHYCLAALRARGPISRAWFVYTGGALLVVKVTVDLLVRNIPGYKVVNYWLTGLPSTFDELTTQLPAILWALPFVWLGTGLCLMRLRDAGMPRVLVPLFFIPAVNFLFFIVCAFVPSAGDEDGNQFEVASRTWSARMLPQSETGIAAFTVLVCAALGVFGVLAGAYGLGNYGAPLFFGLPFFMGFLSALLYGVREQRTVKQCLSIAFVSMVITALALVCFLIEGILCIVALFPIATWLALVGAVLGYAVQARPPSAGGRVESSLVCGLAVMAALALPVPNSPTLTSVTTITVNRPPQDVWPHVIAFSEIAPPKEWLFLQGVAYPVRARIEGKGVGAIRYCEFSTGPFIEPITVWNEPHELRFTVTETPPALTEFNPLGTVIAPHLDGYFESLGGQFLLKEVAPSVTEIQATTWYTHKVAPVWYWELLSEPILHLIHKRVLSHIKSEAEKV